MGDERHRISTATDVQTRGPIFNTLPNCTAGSFTAFNSEFPGRRQSLDFAQPTAPIIRRKFRKVLRSKALRSRSGRVAANCKRNMILAFGEEPRDFGRIAARLAEVNQQPGCAAA